MNKEEFARICEEYCKGKDFIVNPDKEFLDDVYEGVLAEERRTGLRYCPCRIGSGDFEKDIELLCPCNFHIQETWKKEGRCWCGLFVKKK